MVEKEIRVFQVRLKTLRTIRGLKQKELHQLCHIDRGYICKLEKGNKANPTLKILLRLCKALKCNLFDLTGK